MVSGVLANISMAFHFVLSECRRLSDLSPSPAAVSNAGSIQSGVVRLGFVFSDGPYQISLA